MVLPLVVLVVLLVLAAYYLGVTRAMSVADELVQEAADAMEGACDNSFRMGYAAGMAGKEAALDQDDFLADRMGDLFLEQQRAAGEEHRQ